MFRVQGLGSRIQGSGVKVKSLDLRDWGSWFGPLRLRFRFRV